MEDKGGRAGNALRSRAHDPDWHWEPSDYVTAPADAPVITVDLWDDTSSLSGHISGTEKANELRRSTVDELTTVARSAEQGQIDVLGGILDADADASERGAARKAEKEARADVLERAATAEPPRTEAEVDALASNDINDLVPTRADALERAAISEPEKEAEDETLVRDDTDDLAEPDAELAGETESEWRSIGDIPDEVGHVVELDAELGAQSDDWENAEEDTRDEINTLADGIEFFEFDPEARQEIWEADTDGETLRTARQKAAKVAARLSFVRESDRRSAIEWLTELFTARMQPATFRAIYSCVDDGLDLDTLKSMVALRLIWEDRPEWWAVRRGGKTFIHPHGDQLLTWRRAWRICEARYDYAPDDMIDDDWLQEWRILDLGEPGYDAFAGYLDITVQSLHARELGAGLLSAEREISFSETGDDFNWPHRLPYDNPFGSFLQQGPRSHFDYRPIQLIPCDQPQDSAKQSSKRMRVKP